MDFFHQLFLLLRHFSLQSVGDFAVYCGPMLYLAFFGIIFCETGLVVTPFLPGDSLLFAIGVLAATPHPNGGGVSLPVALVCLCVAANCGDALNYFFGYCIGPKVFRSEGSWLLNKKHLMEAHRFYEKHGRKTIILARFVPIVRTFAPFVAGIGKMNFFRFAIFSITGGALWVSLCILAGYKLAKVAFIQQHFDLVVLIVIAISVAPMFFHAISARRRKKQSPTAEPMPGPLPTST